MSFFSRQPLRLLNRSLIARPLPLVVSPVRQGLTSSVRHGLLMRLSSNAASKAPAAGATKYPARLLIFHSPTLETVTVGCARMMGLGIFIISCLVVAPNVYMDPDQANWIAVAVVAVSATPLPIIHVASRAYVANIFIETPAWARRSRESLISFARRLPPDTRLEIETLGLLPWPRTKALRVSELRVIPQGFTRLANLEHVTPADATKKLPKWARWSLEQFYARPTPSRWEKSRAPDVWPLVLDSISRNSVASVRSKVAAPAVNARPVRSVLDAQKRMPAHPKVVSTPHQDKRRR